MITGTLFHACMIGLFVFYFDWGFTGVVWATALMFVARCAMNVGQVVFLDDIKKHDDVHLFSWETIGNIGPLVCIDFQ
jgi:Na+-driven multidrug efflux pump